MLRFQLLWKTIYVLFPFCKGKLTIFNQFVQGINQFVQGWVHDCAGLGARLYRAGCTTVQGWVHAVWISCGNP